MLKEVIQVLHLPRYQEIYDGIDYILQKMEEEQLEYALNYNGIYLSESIILNFYPNQGFRCYNTDQSYVGKNPICSLVERKLNEKAIELICEKVKINS
jgi:hypothetical protein